MRADVIFACTCDLLTCMAQRHHALKSSTDVDEVYPPSCTVQLDCTASGSTKIICTAQCQRLSGNKTLCEVTELEGVQLPDIRHILWNVHA